MKTTERQASKRLFKKLSALRATLSNEERSILDKLIVNEVAAHKMTDRAVGKATTRATSKASEVAAHKMTDRAVGKATTRATSKASEVAAHKMTDRAVGKATTRATSKASEVAAHKMTDRAVGKATTRATGKATSKNTFRIAFDPDSEEYRIQD